MVAPTMPEPRGLTVDQAAAYLNMSKSYVRKLVYGGVLPGRKLGSRLILLREDLDQLLDTAPRA